MIIIQARNKQRKLQEAWNEREKLRAEGNKLLGRARGVLALGEVDRHFEPGLLAEWHKLWAEGSKLRAEGDLVFINAVFSVHGNVEIKWEDDDVIVEGVRYLGENYADA